MSLALSQEIEKRLANYKSVAGIPQYSRITDCLSYLTEDVEFYAERVDDVLSVYLSRSDGRLVGCNLKGISLLAKNVATIMKITDGTLAFRLLLLSAAAAGAFKSYYYDVSDLVGETTIRADEILAVT